MRVIEFIPPVIGIEGEFNTFRLGSFYHKRLTKGEMIYLMDGKEKLLLGTAKVLGVEYATVSELLALHAAKNHTQINKSLDVDPALALEEILRRIYGPHIFALSKKATVIHLRRRN